MTQHTPGPWEYDNEAEGIYSPTHGRGIPVCLVGRNNDANAHLIAAAPELLEALEAVMGVADIPTDGQWFPEFDGIAFSRDSEVWKQVSEAISRATGRE